MFSKCKTTEHTISRFFLIYEKKYDKMFFNVNLESSESVTNQLTYRPYIFLGL